MLIVSLDETWPAMEFKADTMQGVSRAFAVLRFVAAVGSTGARVADVAARLGMHKASASRLLNALVVLEVLERDGDRRFYVSEWFRAAIGSSASVARIRQAARPSLARIADALGDAAFLSVRAGLDALCVERQIGAHPLQALSLDVGSRRPLGVGAGSAALIAWLPEAEREATIAGQEGRLASYPGFSAEMIGEICRAAQARGVTLIRDLVVSGMTGMGIAIRDGTGLVVAALSVAAVGDRLEGQRGERAAALLDEERRATEARLAGQGWCGRASAEAGTEQSASTTGKTLRRKTA